MSTTEPAMPMKDSCGYPARQADHNGPVDEQPDTRIARLEKQRDDFGQSAINNRVSLDIANELLKEVLRASLGDHMTELRLKIKEWIRQNAA